MVKYFCESLRGKIQANQHYQPQLAMLCHCSIYYIWHGRGFPGCSLSLSSAILSAYDDKKFTRDRATIQWWYLASSHYISGCEPLLCPLSSLLCMCLPAVRQRLPPPLLHYRLCKRLFSHSCPNFPIAPYTYKELETLGMLIRPHYVYNQFLLV